jgi:hypothetical protein
MQSREAEGQLKPSVGRIVHVTDDDNGECLAAIVTGTYSDSDNIDALVMSRHDDWHLRGIVSGGVRGNWHWPERAVPA